MIPARSITSRLRSWVISPGRAPVYARSQGTQRFAASNGLRIPVISCAALRITRHSCGRNALVSRSSIFLGTVIFASLKGFVGTYLYSTAQLKTALLARRSVLRSPGGALCRNKASQPLLRFFRTDGLRHLGLQSVGSFVRKRSPKFQP